MSADRGSAQTVLIVLGAIALIAVGLVFVASLLFPAEASQAGLGIGTLVSAVSAQIGALKALTGLSLGADLLLFGAAYIIVCISLWIQAEVRTYLANRSHF